MLDQKLKPWLLEVNLSPACAERTEFLVDMLDRMSDGLFDHLERKLNKVADDFKGKLKAYLSKEKKLSSSWIEIFDQKKSANYKNFAKHSLKELGPYANPR